jgi:TPR repeat protein
MPRPSLSWGICTTTVKALSVTLARRCNGTAAGQGLAASQFSLGRAYENGKGVTQDYVHIGQVFLGSN